MAFTKEELAEMAAFDALIDMEPDYLLPIERIAQAQTDREARWESMDRKSADRAKKAFKYRQEHAVIISENRRKYYQDHKEAERAQNKKWYEEHKNDPDQIARRHANYLIRRDNYQGIRERPLKSRVELIAEQIVRSDNRRIRKLADKIIAEVENGRSNRK